MLDQTTVEFLKEAVREVMACMDPETAGPEYAFVCEEYGMDCPGWLEALDLLVLAGAVKVEYVDGGRIWRKTQP